MTILLLCREQDLAKEPAGYVRAFRRRGIRVVFLEKDTPANADLRQLVALCPEPPQLILHPEQKFLPKGLHASPFPTAILQADPYAYTHRRVRWAMLFDYVLLLHAGFEERFRQAGHPRPLTLPHAVDAEYFARQEQERTFEVSSVGSVDGENYRMRRAVLAALAQEFRMNDWARAHSYEEVAAVYRKTKVVVNIGRDDYPVDVSLRFAEAMAAGALFLTPQPSELDSLGFVEGNHFVGFHHRKEIAPLVRRYLNDEPARRRIAEAAREKVLQEHTYDVRAETFLRNLEIDAGKNFAPARRWPEARAHLIYLDYFAAHRNLDCAASELHAIAGQSLRDTVHGLALLARAWVRINLSSVAQQFDRARNAVSSKFRARPQHERSAVAEMTKEIFILTPEPPETLGGLETFIREQIRGLQERGYAVRVLHRQNSGGVSFLRLVQKISPLIADSLVGLLIGRAAQRAMHPGVAAVISHSVIGWYPLRLPMGCKGVHFYHGTYRRYAEVIREHISLLGYWRMKWWDSMILERLSGRGKMVLCNSGQTAEEVLRYYGCESHVVAMIASPQFVPLDQAVSRRALGLPAEARVGVFVGSLHPMKNFAVVRALVQSLPEVHWLIVLRGELPEEPFAASNVQVLQDLPPTALPTVYAAGDFSLCPSVYEPFGYVVAEALACGTPVIAAPGGASSLFLSDPLVRGLLVPHAEDAHAFLAAVQGVLARPAFYRQLVLERARPKVEQWMSPKTWWRRFFELTGLPDASDQAETAHPCQPMIGVQT